MEAVLNCAVVNNVLARSAAKDGEWRPQRTNIYNVHTADSEWSMRRTQQIKTLINQSGKVKPGLNYNRQ